MSPHWLLYALGGGYGHAVRMAHLAQALGQLGVRASVLCAAEAASRVQGLGVEIIALAPERFRGEAERLRREVERSLELNGSELLLLDNFPEGIYGELAQLRYWGLRGALIRLQRSQVALRGPLSRLDFYVDIEPNLAWLEQPGARRFGPVARRIPINGERGVEVGRVEVLALMQPAYEGLLGRLARRLNQFSWKFIEPSRELLSRELGVARVVIGPAGYNLAYELAGASVWHLGIGSPRAIDDQRRRARALNLLVSSPEALERRLRIILEGNGVRAPMPVYTHRALAEFLLSEVEQLRAFRSR